MKFKKFDTMQKHLNGIHARCNSNTDSSLKDEELFKVEDGSNTVKAEVGYKTESTVMLNK